MGVDRRQGFAANIFLVLAQNRRDIQKNLENPKNYVCICEKMEYNILEKV